MVPEARRAEAVPEAEDTRWYAVLDEEWRGVYNDWEVISANKPSVYVDFESEQAAWD